jgi:hypothetical protein
MAPILQSERPSQGYGFWGCAWRQLQMIKRAITWGHGQQAKSWSTPNITVQRLQHHQAQHSPTGVSISAFNGFTTKCRGLAKERSLARPAKECKGQLDGRCMTCQEY